MDTYCELHDPEVEIRQIDEGKGGIWLVISDAHYERISILMRKDAVVKFFDRLIAQLADSYGPPKEENNEKEETT